MECCCICQCQKTHINNMVSYGCVLGGRLHSVCNTRHNLLVETKEILLLHALFVLRLKCECSGVVCTAHRFNPQALNLARNSFILMDTFYYWLQLSLPQSHTRKCGPIVCFLQCWVHKTMTLCLKQKYLLIKINVNIFLIILLVTQSYSSNNVWKYTVYLCYYICLILRSYPSSVKMSIHNWLKL